MQLRLTKQFDFQMAHALCGYDGKCRNIHGHNYKLMVTVAGTPIDDPDEAKNGMVIDFTDIKHIVDEYVVEPLDHALVLPEGSPYLTLLDGVDNQEDKPKMIVTPFQPTCENMLLYFARLLDGRFPDGVQLYSMRLYETDTSFAELLNFSCSNSLDNLVMGDPHTSLPAGTVLNDGYYTIIDKIGEGGFGITYSAIQNNLNRKVCIKEYFLDGCCFRSEGSLCVECKPSAIEQFEKYRKAFVHEAEMVAAINHLNVVDVIAIFSENNTDYMVMQFIEGQTLDSLVKEKGPIQFAEAMNYMSQIADAVGYIHDRNILHRDIKPSNIMITHDFRAILIDFGSAREFVDNKTQAHTSILTRGYAPPEQYSTMSRKGRYSDIYSLGATFYYVLTATEPVDAAARMSEQLIEPHSINSAIPAHVSRAIMKAMSINTAERYQNVQDFMQDLSSGNFGKVANTPKSFAETQQSKQEESQRGKTRWWVFAGLGVLALIIVVAVIVLGTSKNSDKKDGGKKERIEKQKESKRLGEDVQDKKKNLKSDTTFNVNGVEFKMVYVDDGTFTMGATSGQGSDADDDEMPAHSVTITKGYYIGETEVTQRLYEIVMGTNPSTYKGSDLPVGNISWEEAVAFCNKLSGLTGCTFRLPTEAEWEYAARGGHKAVETKYSGNNTLDEVAWYRDNSSGKTYPIKTKKPNELGIYDMSGCVWEWCQDWYGEYSSATCTNPKGPSAGSCRVIRGGSWFGYASHCRVSNRHTLGTATRSSHLGFRLVLVQ